MAEFTIKRRGEVVRKIFEVLLSAPDGLQAKEVLSRVAQSLSLTEFEKSEYPSRPGVRRFEKMARFSSITVVKAGWLIKEKGRWSLTEEGKHAFHKFKDPEMFYREAWRIYSQWQAQQPEMATDAEEEDPSDALSAVEEAEEVAWAVIEEYLRKMNRTIFRIWWLRFCEPWVITSLGLHRRVSIEVSTSLRTPIRSVPQYLG